MTDLHPLIVAEADDVITAVRANPDFKYVRFSAYGPPEQPLDELIRRGNDGVLPESDVELHMRIYGDFEERHSAGGEVCFWRIQYRGHRIASRRERAKELAIADMRRLEKVVSYHHPDVGVMKRGLTKREFREFFDDQGEPITNASSRFLR